MKGLAAICLADRRKDDAVVTDNIRLLIAAKLTPGLIGQFFVEETLNLAHRYAAIAVPISVSIGGTIVGSQ